MVSLVEQMRMLHQQSAAAKTPDEQARLQQQIDRLVRELYGLTEEEIRIVESDDK
jgi:hypothetical protein